MICRRKATEILHSLSIMALSICIVHGVSCHDGSVSKPVDYPSGWPITYLTAPPGSHRAMITSMPSVKRSDPAFQGHKIDGYRFGQHLEFVIGFTFEGAWEETVKHVEACLSRTTYTEVTRFAVDTITKGNREYELDKASMAVQLNRRRDYGSEQDKYFLRIIVYQ